MMLLTDLDDTVFDWNSSYVPFLLEKNYLKIHKGRYRYTESGYNSNTLWEFQHSEWFAKMEPLPCAKVVLPLFKKAGHDIVAISAAYDTNECVNLRLDKLEQHFPGIFSEVFHTDTTRTSCKSPFLNMFPKGVWVEDNWHNAVMGANIGHRTFLINTSFNSGREHPRVNRVKDWHEIHAEIG